MCPSAWEQATVGQLEDLLAEVSTPGRVLLRRLCLALLESPPCPEALEAARNVFPSLTTGLAGNDHDSELALWREMAETFLRRMPDDVSAARQSKRTMVWRDVVPPELRETIERIEGLPVSQAELLLGALPLAEIAIRKGMGAGEAAPGQGEAAKGQRVPRKGGRRRKTELSEEERQAALNYRQHLARGMAKKAAASLVGYDYKTLERWEGLLGE